ncbi:MAG: hypothetical protein ACREBU_07410 [Nitrososphaera sp.]
MAKKGKKSFLEMLAGTGQPMDWGALSVNPLFNIGLQLLGRSGEQDQSMAQLIGRSGLGALETMGAFQELQARGRERALKEQESALSIQEAEEKKQAKAKRGELAEKYRPYATTPEKQFALDVFGATGDPAALKLLGGQAGGQKLPVGMVINPQTGGLAPMEGFLETKRQIAEATRAPEQLGFTPYQMHTMGMQQQQLEESRALRAETRKKGMVDTSVALSKSYQNNTATKDYGNAAASYNAMVKAPDTAAGDLALIYGAGKVFDPGTGVKEGEMSLVLASQPWIQRHLGTARNVLAGKGRLTPEARADLIAATQTKISELQVQDKGRREWVANSAISYGVDPGTILPKEINLLGTEPPTEVVRAPTTIAAPTVPEQAEIPQKKKAKFLHKHGKTWKLDPKDGQYYATD